MSKLLSARDLTVFAGPRHLVREISFDVAPGEFLAVVGESGSGKSVTSMACCGLLPPELSAQGSVTFDGQDLLRLSSGQWRPLRRNGIAAIFQDPMSSLNPLMKVSAQISEAIDGSTRVDRPKLDRVRALMLEVGLEPTERILQAYPFELSGGQQQRIMIAIGLATNPRLLIADEPTTALDACTQAQVIELLQQLRKSRAMAVLMVTHDLSIVRSAADTIAVFHEGQCVEAGTAKQVMLNPEHPYTQSLVLASMQTVQRDEMNPDQQGSESIVLSARQVSFRYPKALEDALKNISIEVNSGECLGIVGASGSGKSTLAKVLVGALEQTSGMVEVCELASNLRWQTNRTNLAFARQCQYVFQDTTGSLNPIHSVRQTLFDALKLAGFAEFDKSLEQRAADLLAEVGLSLDTLEKLPLSLSGGQRQRVVIARALAMNPKVLVCDEPVSALDAHLQKQVINLLVQLQRRRSMALVFIGHDLHLMAQFCDRLIVMDRGAVVESGMANELFTRPSSDALRELLGQTHGNSANTGAQWVSTTRASATTINEPDLPYVSQTRRTAIAA